MGEDKNMYVSSGQMMDLLNQVQTEKLKSTKEQKDLQNACADFESVLLNYMFQAMKKTVGDGGLFGDNFRKDMYESLFFLKRFPRKLPRPEGSVSVNPYTGS
jgi:Rod binding domain-containing protein